MRYFEPRKLRWHFALLVLAPLSSTPALAPFYPHVLLAALVAWSSYVTSLTACTIAYRLSPFHPLAKYPGPFLCKVSKIYFAVVSFNGKQHEHYNDLHRLYGDIVRTGPNELSFCTPDVIAPMHGPRGMPKAEFWDGQYAEQTTFRSLVGIRDPRVHARVRRVWARGFTPEALRSYQPILNKRVGNLITHFEARVGQTVDLSKWISYFTYDVMSDMAFGDNVEMMQNQDSMGFWKTLEESTPVGMLLAHLPWFAVFVHRVPGVAEKIKIFREQCRNRVLRRLERGASNQDLFYHLMDEGKLDSAPVAIEQVVSDASLVIVAGSDTVSPALCSLFYFILCNPVAYGRLQAEIDESLLSSEDAQGLSQLPYLNAALNESIRIIPPVLSGGARTPLPGSGGFMLGSRFIPEGTTTGVHIYTLHRDPRNFFMPERFLPERWLPIEQQLALEPKLFGSPDQVIHNTEAFIPFSQGPADCVGKRFAFQELRATVFAVLQRFQLQFAVGYDKATWEGEMYDYFVLKKAPLPVVLTPRS
ncbi:hypothetical protein DXG01_003306 [Tephrocybe rancida]|nr:hypothetical protein DXG01_003306 [Tephrocybe rancida]